ncbi:MAG: helix-turn-helix transcriptional regulator [Catenulispora sp.]
MDLTQLAIEQSIATMWSRYNEPLSLDEIADTAILSKFYFSRVFRSMTGTSPGRFLSAIRLFNAKHLLLRTPLSVTEIAYMVGYNSLGTFTSRFTRSVGDSPGRYRSKSRASGHALGGRPAGVGGGDGVGGCGEVSGSVVLPPGGGVVRTFVGLFANPLIEGRPVACAVLDGAGCYSLRGVPAGTWYVRAAAVGVGEVEAQPWVRRPRLLGAGGEVTVAAGARVGERVIGLRKVTILDLPVLLALPELDNWDLPGTTTVHHDTPTTDPMAVPPGAVR